jgi:hypothetical protein
MGALYGFSLVVRKARLAAVLDALAQRGDPEGFHGCTVHLPDHAPLRVPFDGDSEDGPIDVLVVDRPEPASWLAASVWFPVDDRVHEYLERRASRTSSSSGPDRRSSSRATTPPTRNQSIASPSARSR